MSTFLLLLVATVFVYLPFLGNLPLLLARNNDLTEFFWPLFYFIKQNILINNQIPLWNSIFFAGTPLLPDPQNPIWYLPNIIFLFLPIDAAIVTSFFIHSLFGGLGMYFVSRQAFSFSKRTSLFVASLFILTPQIFSYLEAGHWGLIISWAWLPYLFLSAWKLATKANINWVVLFAVSFSSIYFNHILTALVSTSLVFVFWILLIARRKKITKEILHLGLAGIFALGLISIALIPQLEWQSQTTRNLLLLNPETFPIWRGKREFIKTLFIFNPETEKAITFGFIPSLVAFWGFLKLKLRIKIILLTFLFLITLITLNNVSPTFKLLIEMPWFVLLRVTIRVWFLSFFVLMFLFGTGMENLGKKLGFILGSLAIIESVWLGYSYFFKPISGKETVPQKIYEILKKDEGNFRIFCLSRCISQKEAAIRGLRLIDGYGTLQQINYFNSARQLSGAFWDKYTLSIPPFDVYLYQELRPNPELLADYNTKYVISKYPLKDKSFLSLGKFGEFYLYLNKLWEGALYIHYTPNFFRLNTSNSEASTATVPEIYSNGWKAYINGTRETKIHENPNALMRVEILSNTKFVDFVYSPDSFKIGAFITTSTIFLIFSMVFIPFIKKK